MSFLASTLLSVYSGTQKSRRTQRLCWESGMPGKNRDVVCPAKTWEFGESGSPHRPARLIERNHAIRKHCPAHMLNLVFRSINPQHPIFILISATVPERFVRSAVGANPFHSARLGTRATFLSDISARVA